LCRFDPDRKRSRLAAGRLAGLAALPRNALPHKPYLQCQGGGTGRRGNPGVPRRSRAPLRRTATAARVTRLLKIDLRVDHRRLVLQILRAHLPQNAKAWVFGSRATGRARRYSDLDLAIDAGRKLTLDEIARLAEAFSDSNLPYRVDLIDWYEIDDRWRQIIVAERVPLTEAAQTDRAG